jgi:predicted amidohydrolase
MPDPFPLAMAQMLVVPGDPEPNLQRACDMIRQAAAAGCSLVVLPECLDLGWTHPSAREKAAPIPGERSGLLAAAARRNRIYVAAGLTERDGDRIYNAAILLAPDGRLLLRHRKINELDIATGLYSTGTALAVVETALGTIGLTVCADNFPDSLVFGHSLARMGAQLLLSPCAWAVDHDHDPVATPYGQLWLDSYTSLARAYDLTVVGVSNVGPLTGGPWQGRKCIGCSMAVGPAGAVLARGPYGEDAEALIVAEVSPQPPIACGTGFAEALRKREAVCG